MTAACWLRKRGCLLISLKWWLRGSICAREMVLRQMVCPVRSWRHRWVNKMLNSGVKAICRKSRLGGACPVSGLGRHARGGDDSRPLKAAAVYVVFMVAASRRFEAVVERCHGGELEQQTHMVVLPCFSSRNGNSRTQSESKWLTFVAGSRKFLQ